MGGLQRDDQYPGPVCRGEANYQYHGANRLGANSLLSCIFDGMVTGPNALEYVRGLDQSAEDLSSTLFEAYQKKEQEKYDNILKMDGDENPYQLHKELGRMDDG